MFKKYLIYVVLVAGLIMAGCGGGGGEVAAILRKIPPVFVSIQVRL